MPETLLALARVCVEQASLSSTPAAAEALRQMAREFELRARRRRHELERVAAQAEALQTRDAR